MLANKSADATHRFQPFQPSSELVEKVDQPNQPNFFFFEGFNLGFNIFIL